MFTFISSNINKITSAKKRLSEANIEFSQQALNLIEIQSTDGKQIALHKATQSFDQLHKPIVVHDSFWEIPALKGFPGPYMHDIGKWLTATDFINLMKSKKNKTVNNISILVYKDINITKVFTYARVYTFLDKPKGIGNFEFDRVISARADKKSLAECDDEGLEKFDDKGSVWDLFIDWYKLYI